MLKPFNELRKVDVSPYIEKRDGNDYLNWAKCTDLLHENGATTVYFKPLTNSAGSSLFMSEKEFADKNGNTNRCYEVAVEIVIDDLKFEIRSPIMNGANPVKDNSMSQQRVWNAVTRAYTKGVAIYTGLGFGLWSDSDEDKTADDDLSKHSLKAIQERVQQIYTQKIKTKKMSTPDIAKGLGMTENELKAYFSYYDILIRFENNLISL